MKENANVVIYNVDNEYLTKVEDLLIKKLNEWYKYKGLDLVVTTFTMGDLGRIQVDCEFEKNVDIKTIKEITDTFLNEFNIEYTYEYTTLK
ncbi:hypothetical protein UT300003_32390 [Clostridium sardiniense]